MNCFHYTPGYLSLSRKNLSWHKNNFHSFPHISLLSTLALLKNWGIVFLPAAPRPAFSSNHTPQSVGRKLTTLRERTVRIRKVVGSIPIRSTISRKITANSAVIFRLTTIIPQTAENPDHFWNPQAVSSSPSPPADFRFMCLPVRQVLL